MTVKELIEQLEQYDEDCIVLMDTGDANLTYVDEVDAGDMYQVVLR